MKSLKLLLVLSVAISFTFCSSSDSLKVIPKDTNVVAVVDFYSLIKKGQLDEITELKIFKGIKKEIKNENKKLSKFVSNLTDDPTLTGLKFTSDIFMFLIDEGNDQKYTAFSMEINDDEKFAEFLENAMEKLGLDCDIENEENYNYALSTSEAIWGWDEDKLVLLIATNYSSRKNLEDTIETIMELDEEDQISENEEFVNFHKNKKDISLWVSSNLMKSSEFAGMYDEITKEIDYDLEDNYASFFINFDDDNISLKAKFTPNSEIQELMDENDWSNSFNDDLLKNFPNKNNLVGSISINPMAFYNNIEQQDGKEFESFKSEFEEELGFELKELFESFKGNAVFSLYGFENIEYTYMGYGYGFNKNKAKLLETKHTIDNAGTLSSEQKRLLNQGKTIQTPKYPRNSINIKNVLDRGGNVEEAIEQNMAVIWYEGGREYGRYVEKTKKEYLPLMGMSMDLNGNKMMKKLVKKMSENNNNEIKKRGDYYETKFENRYPLFFAFNEEVCFITNDEKSIKKFKDGGYDDSLSNSEMSDNMFYSYLNLDLDDYSKEFEKKMKDGMSRSDEKLFEIWNELAKSVEFKVEDNYSFEMTFNTKESDTNTLNNIITLLDDNYKKLSL